ncbi:component of the polarisome [Borealophlyctis nickersoniae]|nr:component of the polarisome [Borealophlyctis nickersoniae]
MSRDVAVEIAATHYESLRQYLASYLQSQRSGNNPSNQRSSAREKLTRLTKQQFTELSTDVFDEMNRRQLNSQEAPFLPVRDDFHPKRNQARQKLATLPSGRFKDLASDVYFEIERRFPMVVQQYNAKYGEKHPLPSTGGEFEPKQVAPITTAPPPVVQTYETQYSPSYDESRSTVGTDRSWGQKPASSSASAGGSGGGGIGGGAGGADPAVNFTSLDTLMADLGSMLVEPKGANGKEELERIRAEYESRLNTLQDRIHQLEKEAQEQARTGDRVADLEAQLSRERSISAEQGTALAALEEKHKKLKRDFDSLQDDYNNQQQIANDIRSEATNLLEEIRNLSRKNEELNAEKERDAQTIRDLKEQLARAKGQELQSAAYGGGRDRNMDASEEVGDDEGIIDRSRVAAYQNAVEELLQAARSDTPTSVLVAMKAIVIACKNITEDTENYENSSDTLTPDERDQLADTKNQLSGALTNLMTAAKHHATNYGSSNVADLDGAATQLTATIVELVKMLRFKRDGNEGGGGGAGGSAGRSDAYDTGMNGGRRPRPESYEIDELKIFLEKQTDMIVQAIQTLLYAMRQSTTFGQDFKDTVRGITDIVDNLVSVSRRTLAKPSAVEFRTRGEMILQDLANANQKLEELGVSMVNSPQSKSLKQRLASSSYEIAKYVKELISLIE